MTARNNIGVQGVKENLDIKVIAESVDPETDLKAIVSAYKTDRATLWNYSQQLV
jgi:cytochrome oxidase Cu insertion factor (SCO1/SenC/PrrC family)